MENTKENRERFFALYWGQKVGITKYVSNLNINKSNIGNAEALRLKCILSITEEDAKALCIRLVKVVGMDGIIQKPSVELVRELVSNYSRVGCLQHLPAEFTDKARELGYAMPAFDLSIEKLVERGWIKLPE